MVFAIIPSLQRAAFSFFAKAKGNSAIMRNRMLLKSQNFQTKKSKKFIYILCFLLTLFISMRFYYLKEDFFTHLILYLYPEYIVKPMSWLVEPQKLNSKLILTKISYYNPQIFIRLVDRGLCINPSLQKDSKDSVVWVIENSPNAPHLSEIVKILLSKGAPVEGGIQEYTPLMAAAGVGNKSVVNVLVEAGGKVDAKTKDGWTALIVAARKHHINIVQQLIEFGAEINTQTTDNNTTALMEASSYNSDLELVKLLIKNGANPFLKNNRGETACDIASRLAHTPPKSGESYRDPAKNEVVAKYLKTIMEAPANSAR